MIRPDAFLLDMDGVLVDSMKYHALAWRTILAEYGVSIDDHDVYLREGMSGIESIGDIFREKGVPFPDGDGFARLQERKHRLYEGYRIGLFPDAERLVDLLRAAGCSLALVTGSYMRSVRHVLPAGIISRFDAIVTAESVSRGKPDPEPYLAALAKLGLPPGRAVAIENAPQGIASVHAAGVYCCAIETTLPGEYLAGADIVFRDHSECIGRLEEFFAGGPGAFFN